MKVRRLITMLRNELDDNPLNEATRLWPDQELAAYLDEGAVKFCKDARVLKDGTTVAETLATATVQLEGTSGQIDSVEVNGVEITSAAVPFDTDLATTASNLADNINAYTSSPNYTADDSAGDGSLIISAVAGTGGNPNGYDVVITCSGGDLSADDTEMASGTSICELYLLAGRAKYPVDSRVVQIERIKPSGRHALTKKSKVWMDENIPGWEEASSGTPEVFITDAEKDTVIFFPPPNAAETVKATVARHPITSMLVDENTVYDDLDIELHDDDLVAVRYWARSCAYRKDDAETLRPDKADDFEGKYYREVEQKKRQMLLADATGSSVQPDAGGL